LERHSARRRGHGEDSVYFDAANNCWAGAVSLGYSPDGKRRVRRKVTGRTKTEVKDKLKIVHSELDARIQPVARYTMALCIEDWLSQGLTNRSPSTVANYRLLAEHAVSKLGAIRLKELTAKHVQAALVELSGSLSTRSLRLVHQILERAIRHAQAGDLVGRNVASLVDAPAGKGGRPSRALTLGQAEAVLNAAEDSPLHAYVVLSLLAGLRTEELRSLLWADVDLDAGTLAVHRSVRLSGDTKTPKSRCVLKLPAKATDALREHRSQQIGARLKAGQQWQDHGLVFTSTVGTPLDAHNVRRSLRVITKAAGLGQEWTPRELRHTFVSLLSANDVTLDSTPRKPAWRRNIGSEILSAKSSYSGARDSSRRVRQIRTTRGRKGTSCFHVALTGGTAAWPYSRWSRTLHQVAAHLFSSWARVAGARVASAIMRSPPAGRGRVLAAAGRSAFSGGCRIGPESTSGRGLAGSGRRRSTGSRWPGTSSAAPTVRVRTDPRR
jgi:integrase